MGQRAYDAIVLGVGGMGSATAFELARRGRRVLGLEQFSLGHDRGSSHGQSRVIRKAYSDHPAYVALLHRAYERWRDLERRQGRSLFAVCGCLTLGPPQGDRVAGVLGSARDHQLRIELMSAAEVRRRYPPFHIGDDFVGVLEPEAGFLRVEECVIAHAEEARRLGADLRTQVTVRSWQATANRVVVRTQNEEFAAEKLVICAGAWSSRVLAELGLPLTVRRMALSWHATVDDELFRPDRFPVYRAQTPEGVFYGFPVTDALGHKVARSDSGSAIGGPNELDRTMSPADKAECRPFLDRYLPAVSGPFCAGQACMYTMTPDKNFILDRHPQHPNVVIAAGFSGHGFKFASVVGEILADLTESPRSALPIEPFRIGRFLH